MVFQNGYLLQLIDAETRLPLNEYTGPTGTVHYAEAKPGGEYFLRFQVLNDHGGGGGEQEQEKVFYFRPAVDGKDLGFYTNLTYSSGARDVGLWTYVNGVGTNKALRFEPATKRMEEGVNSDDNNNHLNNSNNNASDDDESSNNNKQQPPPMLSMGNVQVQISEAIFTGNQKREYSVPPLTESETVAAPTVSVSASSSIQEGEEDGAAAGEHKTESPAEYAEPVPVLRSQEGALTFEDNYAEKCPTYKPGKLLDTITIHYGSTAALVQAGILVPVMTTPGMVPPYVGGAPITTLPAPVPATTGTDTAKTTTSEPVAVSGTSENNTKDSASKPLQGLVPNPLVATKTSDATTAKRSASDNKKSTEPAAKKTCTSMGPESSSENKNRTMVSTK